MCESGLKKKRSVAHAPRTLGRRFWKKLSGKRGPKSPGCTECRQGLQNVLRDEVAKVYRKCAHRVQARMRGTAAYAPSPASTAASASYTGAYASPRTREVHGNA